MSLAQKVLQGELKHESGHTTRSPTYPELGLLSEDIEGSLLLQQLGLQVFAACRGGQLLSVQPGSYLSRRGVGAETAAGTDAGPDTLEGGWAG